MVRLSEIFNFVKTPSLYFSPYQASVHPDAENDSNLFNTLKKKDILLHHPFQTFKTVIDFIRNAADDPDVFVIKQTIYRAGMTSELMEALISAANKGKEVIVIVELKARFDEEQNIDWAQQLEQAGAQVVYGVMGLKTHAKLALVIRREQGAFRYYCYLGLALNHIYDPTRQAETSYAVFCLTQETRRRIICSTLPHTKYMRSKNKRVSVEES